MNRNERLKARRQIVENHIEVRKWQTDDLGVGICPHDHEHLWMHIGDPIHLHCPSGPERRCWPDLQRLADEITDEVSQIEGGLPPLRLRQELRPIVKRAALVDLPPLRELWTKMHAKPRQAEELINKSPFRIPADPRDQWQPLIRAAFMNSQNVWIGERHETSDKRFSSNFLPCSSWMQRSAKAGRDAPAPGPLWRTGALLSGTLLRRKAEVLGQKLFAFESNKQLLEQQAAALLWMIEEGVPIFSVAYSGNKSYHATVFFARGPADPGFDAVRRNLCALGFDLGPFRLAGTSRLPGYWRTDTDDGEARWQTLLYLNPALTQAEWDREERERQQARVYHSSGQYEIDSAASDVEIHKMGQWQLEQKARGRVFGFERDNLGRPRLPDKICEELEEGGYAALDARKLKNTVLRLALELPFDLLNQALPLRDAEIMQRLADTLNDLKVPRLVDGLGDIEERRDEDETCRRWLWQDIARLVRKTFEEVPIIICGRYRVELRNGDQLFVSPNEQVYD